MTPFRLSLFKGLLGRRRVRRQRTATSLRPRLEQLEDRVVPSGTDPYTLYTYGDAYTGAPGQDRQSFLANYQPFDPALGGSSPLGQPGPDANDPGSPGPYAVTTQEYNLGNLAFRPTDAAWASSGIELTGEIKAPTDLGDTAHPVVILLHGRHSTTYDPVTGAAFLEWPATGNHLPIPSYRGYDYLGDVLASNGYVVVSIGADGINARDNSAADAGALARAQLIQRTLGILQDLNTDGVIRPRAADATHPGTDLFTGTSSPFGTRFVGKLDLQDVGLMGHSRGGEGVVRSYILNQSLGSPYGIKAVFALAPIDFQGELINNVPFAVLLPYNDGDVSDLQGAHFFDDSRYNVAGDTGPKFSIEVMGADHNFYNTVWSPGLFPFAGAPSGFGGTADDGNSGPPTRLTETQEQGTGLAYMSAFFRTYLGGETQFLPILTGDAPPPPSALVTPDRIHIGYLPPDDAIDRRDVNRLLTTANQTTNTLGGAVVTGGLTTYTVGGPVSGEVDRDNQLSLGYSNTLTAFYENDLPVGLRDERNYTDLEFRIGVNWADSRNPLNTDQDFSVELDDGSGHSYSVLVSTYSNDLFYPPRSSNPHEVLNTVRIPLSAFAGHIDLSNVTAVRFDFDQHSSGAFQIADLAFADPAPAAGPYVVSSTPTDGTFTAQGSVRVTFDRPIDVSTFTPASIDSFTRTVGSTVTDLLSTITGVTPVAGSGNRQFDISFTPQNALGLYQLVIGPDIKDLVGDSMDQNHNLIPGEIPDDEYTAAFTIQGPRVIAESPSGTNNLPNTVNHVRLTFNEPIVPGTLNTGDVFAHGPNGAVAITSITAVAGSGNTQFDVNFATLTQTGVYDVFVLPFVTDAAGHQLDQNQNFVAGELPGDIYVAEFGVTGPQVVSAAANSTTAGQVFRLRVTFNEDIDPTSFTRNSIASFTDPTGRDILGSVVAVAQVSPGNFRQFDVLFTPATKAGTYTLVIGPQVRDVYGNAMDQDADAALPVGADDAYTATFTVSGPVVVATTPAAGSAVASPFDHLLVTFNTPVQASSFTTDQVMLLGPSGQPVNVTGVTPVPFTNDTQFTITFDAQTAPGTYILKLGPGILDTYGNPMDAPFTATYRIAINYTASVETFQNLEIFGQAGTQTLTFTSGAVTADDDYGTINLGGNSFTFYGQTYSQLFVSSNGAITFGAGTTAIEPSTADSRYNPALAYIAPYWTDLFKSGTEPMIVWRIDGNQLTIEWYKVTTFDGSPQMTFQVILDLNTGATPGDIVFNYSSVTGTGDQPENIGVSVGVKDVGTGSAVARTVVEDGTTGYSSTGDPRVQTGRAIRLHAS